MSFKVLYVEDEQFLAKIVSDGLKKSGYEVQLISDGGLVIEAFKAFEPDICLLDIMLPSKDGFEIARELRVFAPNVPIIFLSAKVQSEDVVKGFKSGGNDYLKKPFSIDELLIRMESLLDRFDPDKNPEKEKNTTVYQFGKCTLDTVQQVLKTSSEEHFLSFKECALLELLIINKNDVLERKKALLQIWEEDSYYNSRSLDVFMSQLRKLLKKESDLKILTLRGIGFKLICD